MKRTAFRNLVMSALALLFTVESHAVNRYHSSELPAEFRDTREAYDLKGNPAEAANERAQLGRSQIHALSEVNRLVQEASSNPACSESCLTGLKSVQTVLALKEKMGLSNTFLPEKVVQDILNERASGTPLNIAIERALNKYGLVEESIKECSVLQDVAICETAFNLPVVPSRANNASMTLTALEMKIRGLRSTISRTETYVPPGPPPNIFTSAFRKPPLIMARPPEITSEDVRDLLESAKVIQQIALNTSDLSFDGLESMVNANKVAKLYLAVADRLKLLKSDPRVDQAIEVLKSTIALEKQNYLNLDTATLANLGPMDRENLRLQIDTSLSRLSGSAEKMNLYLPTVRVAGQRAIFANTAHNDKVSVINRYSIYADLKTYYGTLLATATIAEKAGLFTPQLRDEMQAARYRVGEIDRTLRNLTGAPLNYEADDHALLTILQRAK